MERGGDWASPVQGLFLFPRVSSQARCLEVRNLGREPCLPADDSSKLTVEPYSASQPLDRSWLPVCRGYSAQERVQYFRGRQKNRKGGCRQRAREGGNGRSRGHPRSPG